MNLGQNDERAGAFHGVGVQGNDRTLVIGGLVDHKVVGQLLPLGDSRGVVFLRLLAPEHKKDQEFKFIC